MKMLTIEYLDAIKARHNWTSDYRIAKELEISLSLMSKYRNGKSTFGDEICLKVAKLLNINPAQVLIDIAAERTKSSKAAKILHDTAKQLTSAAASLLLTLSMIYGALAPSESIACEAGAPHLSHYQLTIEPNTYFHKHTPVLPESDQLWDIQTQCQSVLAEQGYDQYEISAYSKPGRRCLHNVNYWQFGDYIGIGAGAHGKITSDRHGFELRRRWKHRQPQQYIEQSMVGDAISGEQKIEKQELVFEFLLNALRLREGASLAIFEQRSGLPLENLEQAIKNIDPALLSLDNGQIAASEKGFLFLNEILQELV